MRLWLITAFCRLTGPWRQYVRATTPEDAIAGYCLEHGMEPWQCQAEEILELKTETLKS